MSSGTFENIGRSLDQGIHASKEWAKNTTNAAVDTAVDAWNSSVDVAERLRSNLTTRAKNAYNRASAWADLRLNQWREFLRAAGAKASEISRSMDQAMARGINYGREKALQIAREIVAVDQKIRSGIMSAAATGIGLSMMGADYVVSNGKLYVSIRVQRGKRFMVQASELAYATRVSLQNSLRNAALRAQVISNHLSDLQRRAEARGRQSFESSQKIKKQKNSTETQQRPHSRQHAEQ